jgi:hypothetical protein
MSFDMAQAISQLVGVAVGAGITGVISVHTFRRQRADSLAAEDRAHQALVGNERRAREINATALAKESLIKLLLLKEDPDADRVRQINRRVRLGQSRNQVVAELSEDNDAIDEWHRTRDSLIFAVDAASQDIANEEFRMRLSEACDVLRFYRGPENQARQPESRTRYIVISYALKCIGAFRRGDPLPDKSKDYSDTCEFAMLYLEELEMNSRDQRALENQ